jgi:hypothetical protein
LRRGEAALAGGVMLPEASSTAMRLLTEIVGGFNRLRKNASLLSF